MGNTHASRIFTNVKDRLHSLNMRDRPPVLIIFSLPNTCNSLAKQFI